MLNSSLLYFPVRGLFVLHTFLSEYIYAPLCLYLHPYASWSFSFSHSDFISNTHTLSCSLHQSVSKTSKEMSDQAAVLYPFFRTFLEFQLLTGILLEWIKSQSSNPANITEERHSGRETERKFFRKVGWQKGQSSCLFVDYQHSWMRVQRGTTSKL